MVYYEIVLNSETNTFNPGSEFSGKIIVKSEKEIKARKIDMKVHGRAKTLWYYMYRNRNGYANGYEYGYDYGYEYGYGYRNRYGHERVTQVGCQEDYINQYVILWESSDGTNRLPPGLYQFPFTVKIPPNIPGNYLKEDRGSIEYYIKTTIDVPWGFDKERNYEFNVSSVVDLNIDQKLSLQACMDARKLYSRFCSCKTDSISLKVTLPKTGYICNELIHISMDISNKTSSKITEIEIGFNEETVFVGNYNSQPQLPREDSFKEVERKNIYRKMYKPPRYTNEPYIYEITVPSWMGPSINQCSIIKVLYSLFVKVHTSSAFSSGPEIEMPITIGTIPIQEKQISSQTSVLHKSKNSDAALNNKNKKKKRSKSKSDSSKGKEKP